MFLAILEVKVSSKMELDLWQLQSTSCLADEAASEEAVL
jgi:hypothetical protein